MRWATARVLPVPAPASTQTGPRAATATSRCSGSSAERTDSGPCGSSDPAGSDPAGPDPADPDPAGPDPARPDSSSTTHLLCGPSSRTAPTSRARPRPLGRRGAVGVLRSEEHTSELQSPMY